MFSKLSLIVKKISGVKTIWESGLIKLSLNLYYSCFQSKINGNFNDSLKHFILQHAMQGIAHLRFTHTERQLSSSLDYFVLKTVQVMVRTTPRSGKHFGGEFFGQIFLRIEQKNLRVEEKKFGWKKSWVNIFFVWKLLLAGKKMFSEKI